MTDIEEIERLRSEHGRPGMTAGEFAELLPEHLRRPYWRMKLDEWFRAQGLDPDEEPGR
jgi:hypothetical protein